MILSPNFLTNLPTFNLFTNVLFFIAILFPWIRNGSHILQGDHSVQLNLFNLITGLTLIVGLYALLDTLSIQESDFEEYRGGTMVFLWFWLGVFFLGIFSLINLCSEILFLAFYLTVRWLFLYRKTPTVYNWLMDSLRTIQYKSFGLGMVGGILLSIPVLI